MPTEVTTVVVVLLAALGVWVIVAFNRLVRARNLMREGWSGIDVQLRRRRKMMPNAPAVTSASVAGSGTVLCSTIVIARSWLVAAPRR